MGRPRKEPMPIKPEECDNPMYEAIKQIYRENGLAPLTIEDKIAINVQLTKKEK